MLSYQGEEFGYVLKGCITIVQGSKKYKVKAKETFYMNGDKSRLPCRVIMETLRRKCCGLQRRPDVLNTKDVQRRLGKN